MALPFVSQPQKQPKDKTAKQPLMRGKGKCFLSTQPKEIPRHGMLRVAKIKRQRK